MRCEINLHVIVEPAQVTYVGNRKTLHQFIVYQRHEGMELRQEQPEILVILQRHARYKLLYLLAHCDRNNGVNRPS